MPRRKPGAPPVYRLRTILVEIEVEEDTASPYDEDDIIRWFRENEPEFRVIRVEFPNGSYWDEPPDPTLIPDKS